MAITATVTPLRDRRKYSVLPKGVSRWTASDATLTGVGTSTATFDLQFNPGSDPNFQLYVSINRLVISTAAAALVILGVHARLRAAEWEEAPSGVAIPIASFEMINEENATSYIGGIHEAIYLGRTEKGTPGRLQVFIQEIASTTYVFSASGLMSDKPFLAPNFWRP